MPKTDFLSRHKFSPDAAYLETQAESLKAFERALSSLIRDWGKYQPNDSLSATRKQDLEWLKSILHDYRQNIHNSSNSGDFWKGCMEGKNSRRILSDRYSKSVLQILLGAFTTTETQQMYELGIQAGWRYTRLKDYLQHLKKQRNLEVAQQLQDYQQISNLIRRKDETDNTESILRFG